MGIINAHTLKYAWYGLKEFYESAKEELSDLFSSKTGITEVFDNGSQTHKILMLGGRRAGKSTILASIHNALGSSTPGSICTITDETDYSSIEQELPTLDNKRLEVVDYIEDKSDKKMFLVDMAPTQSQNSYTLRVNAEKTSIKLEFVDIPGEWMRKQNADYKTLKELTKETDVFVIVIDTPFLMLGRPNENEVYNRIKEITDLLVSEIRSANDADKKLFLICPVKCEKWVRQGLADDVTQKAKSVYKTLINTYVKHPWADIRVMPIQTVGGIESVKLLDALLYFKDKKDMMGTSCSKDGEMLIDRNGNIIDETKIDRVEKDMAWKIDHTKLSLSWYKTNGDGFKPVYCEQPGYHILKFLVEKEENILKVKKEKEKKDLEADNFIVRWFTQTFNPTFGQYLPVWDSVIRGLDEQKLIKESGDGFELVKKVIN